MRFFWTGAMVCRNRIPVKPKAIILLHHRIEVHKRPWGPASPGGFQTAARLIMSSPHPSPPRESSRLIYSPWYSGAKTARSYLPLLSKSGHRNFFSYRAPTTFFTSLRRAPAYLGFQDTPFEFCLVHTSLRIVRSGSVAREGQFQFKASPPWRKIPQKITISH